jgi:hypothetical protein
VVVESQNFPNAAGRVQRQPDGLGSFPPECWQFDVSAALPPVAASAVNGTESSAAGAKAGSSADGMAGLTPSSHRWWGRSTVLSRADPYGNKRSHRGRSDTCIIEAMKLMNEIQSDIAAVW